MISALKENNFKGNPYLKFILLFIGLIILWFSCYHYIYQLDGLLSCELPIQQGISTLLAKGSNATLELLGIDTDLIISPPFVVTRIIGAPNEHGVWIGEPCNGVKLFGLFAIFVISFPGALKHKLWFIPLGILLIHVINIFRIAILTFISSYNYEILEFNHNVTFQVVIYGLIFGLWYYWVNKFAVPYLKKSSD